MASKSHTLITYIHVAIITLLAALLSGTIVYRFTSMLALKSSIEVKDYQIPDLYIAVADSIIEPKISSNVILVSTDSLDRVQIAEVINMVRQFSPKSIAVDLAFKYKQPNDSILIAATAAPNIVMGAEISADSTIQLISYFCKDGYPAKIGVANTENRKPVDVVRRYRNVYNVEGRQYYSFAVEAARLAGYSISSDTDLGTIYYPAQRFWILTRQNLIESPHECGQLLKDKIVLIGDTNNSKDKHQTPIGVKSGLIINACIIETIVENHQIKISSSYVNWTIAVISCFLLVLFNIYLTRRNLAMGKLLFRLSQIIILFLYFLIGCWLYAKHNVSVDFTPSLSMIAVGLLSYDIYFGLVALYKKLIIKIIKK